jgi:phosphoglucosamine mutase
MKRQYFGTDGVRGEFGGPVINPTFAWRLGVAAGRWLADQGLREPLVLIGRDTRFSGPVLVAALAAGLQSTGAVVQSLGIVPTPAVSLAVRHFHAALGVVVTASHNPAADNGIKFFSAAGTKLDDAIELTIESLLPAASGAPSGSPAPDAALEEVAAERVFLDRLATVLPAHALAGWKLVVDAGNGAAFRTTPAMLRQLGADVTVINDQPDGRNINAECGSQHPQAMQRLVVELGARFGLAHDGDADRLILADETGAEVDGDEILAILAAHLLESGRLKHRTLVATVQSNLGLTRFMEARGGRLVATAVGDRYVLEAMLAGGYNLGGESSGHVICTDISPCGDGLGAALLVLGAMRASDQPLSALRRGLTKFPQRTKAMKVARKPEIATLPALRAAIATAEQRLGSDGRVMVRYSGTEPKIRLLVEGADAALVDELVADLATAVRVELPEA